MKTTEIITALTAEQHRQGVKDTELIKALNINKVTLWRMKTGQTAPTATHLTGIAEYLGLKLVLIKKDQIIKNK